MKKFTIFEENLNRFEKDSFGPALFLDRDGVIIKDCHYIKDPSNVELEKNINKVIDLANNAGWLIIVVTNQSGVNNNPPNNDVIVQANKPQVSIASIKKTTSNIPFVKLSKNQYLSINESELPPEVARMIT